MKSQSKHVQHKRRGIPHEVEFNVEEHTASTPESRRKADFSDVVGRWRPDPAFDEIVASLRRIDRDKWN